MEGDLRHLKEEAYRLKIQTEEKGIMRKELIDEIDKLQIKIGRAKEQNLLLQKSIRRTKKTKSKIFEEVSPLSRFCISIKLSFSYRDEAVLHAYFCISVRF